MFTAIYILLWLVYITDIARSSIETCYCYILRLVILHNKKIINLFIFFTVIYCHLHFSEVVHCMDSMTDPSLPLKNKIAQVEYKIEYFKEQAGVAEGDFKEVLYDKPYFESVDNMSGWEHNFRLVKTALRDTHTNLNSETRMLKILKAKLERGDYDMNLKYVVAKRKFSD